MKIPKICSGRPWASKVTVSEEPTTSFQPAGVAVRSSCQAVGTPELRNYSERTAQFIDEEVRKLTSEALDRAREVLRSNRDKVEAVAARLLANELVEEEELRQLLGPKVTASVPLLSHHHAEAEPRPADTHREPTGPPH